MPDLPAHIQIGPWTCAVVSDNAEINARSNEEEADLVGHWSPRALTITLRPDIARDVLAETVLHETLHGILDQIGVRSELGAEDTEGVVIRLAPLLLDVLRRNPQLVAYLTVQ